MITFKSHDDLLKLHPDDPAKPVMEELIEVLIDDFTDPGQTYNADDFGYLVLIEPGDADRVLTDIDMPWTLAQVPWEGASMRQGFTLTATPFNIPSSSLKSTDPYASASLRRRSFACGFRGVRGEQPMEIHHDDSNHTQPCYTRASSRGPETVDHGETIRHSLPASYRTGFVFNN